MRLIQAMCGLAFLAAVATGCATDDHTTSGSADSTETATPGDDAMPTNDQEDMGMGSMGMPHMHATCEASGGVCSTQHACSSVNARMITAMCPASLSCCISD